MVFTKYYFLYTQENYPPSYSYKIANFEADKVFQKRFLIPLVAKYISFCFDLSLDTSLKVLITISTFFLIFGFSSLLNQISSCKISIYWGFIILIPVTWNYMFLNSIYHSYDIPTLTFYCIGLSLFMQKRYWEFYMIFIIGTFNRESTCFITISAILLLARYNDMKKPFDLFKKNINLTTHTIIQLLVWLCITTFVKLYFNKNPGNFYEDTFSMNIFLLNLWHGNASWPFLNPENFFGNPRCFLTLFAGIWILIPISWNYIPSQFKKLLLLIPVYLVPAYLYANLMETRVYHELNVVIALSITPLLSNYLSKFKFST